MELQNSANGEESCEYEEIDSNCSTPYVSAPSSPGRFPAVGCYFFSAPTSPMHYVLSTPPYSASVSSSPTAVQADSSFNASAEFEFSAKEAFFTHSADELFLNGQIRPMKLSSHLQRPQILAPLVDVEEEDESAKMRSRSIRRRARSMSPSRNKRFEWHVEGDEEEKRDDKGEEKASEETLFTPCVSASTSRSSSSGGNSRRWVFLKELLYRSKSEGRAVAKERFWHSISFSPSKEKSKATVPVPPQSKRSGFSSANSAEALKGSGGKRRWPVPSAHEKLYTANRAQTEEMRKRTFLPYRQGLFGCLGFNSRSYGAMSGYAKTLNPVSSR